MNEKDNCVLCVCSKYLKRSGRYGPSLGVYRTEFDRDRDRILYSKSFRRLSGKTQVVGSIKGDHLRTRLTHTLEVAQISRLIARNLGLNEILVEAIALGHDLGHTPFGHVGERTLNSIMNCCDPIGGFQSHMMATDMGFKHNLQGLRVTCELERLYEREGLNLTNFTLWGIANHSSLKYKDCEYYNQECDPLERCYLRRTPCLCNKKKIYGLQNEKQLSKPVFDLNFYDRYAHAADFQKNKPAWSFEGFVVRLADEIAQRHHDLEDAVNLEVLSPDDIISELEDEFNDLLEKKTSTTSNENISLFGNLKVKNIRRDQRLFLPYLSKFIISLYTEKLITNSENEINKLLQDLAIKTREDFENIYPKLKMSQVNNVLCFDEVFEKRDRNFQTFLRDRILNSFKVQEMDGKGKYVIRRLFKAYLTNPRQLFDTTITYAFKTYNKDEYSKLKPDKRTIGEMRSLVDSGKFKADNRFQIALLRAICDNIAGMTDDFAIQQYKKLYG